MKYSKEDIVGVQVKGYVNPLKKNQVANLIDPVEKPPKKIGSHIMYVELPDSDVFFREDGESFSIEDIVSVVEGECSDYSFVWNSSAIIEAIEKDYPLEIVYEVCEGKFLIDFVTERTYMELAGDAGCWAKHFGVKPTEPYVDEYAIVRYHYSAAFYDISVEKFLRILLDMPTSERYRVKPHVIWEKVFQ